MQSSAMNWQSGDTTCETRGAGSNRRIRGAPLGGLPRQDHHSEPLRRDIRDFTDPSWLLRYWLSGGPAGNRPAYRINAGRRQGDESLALMFPAAVAVVDADRRLVLRLTSYVGTRPVQRHELRDVTTDVGDFRIKIPADLPTVEESWRSAPNASARPSATGTANPLQRGTRRAARLRLQTAICVITVGYLRKGVRWRG